MNSAVAAGAGIGALALGLVFLMYQIGRWRGGDPTSPMHFVAGLVIAALLLLGGGILGTMGGAAAALGDGIGTYALAGASGVHHTGTLHPTGSERVGVGGVLVGLCLAALYAGLIKSGRSDLKSPLLRGALCGIWLGPGAGLLGMWLGLVRTSGDTVGDLLLHSL